MVVILFLFFLDVIKNLYFLVGVKGDIFNNFG